MSVCAIDWVMSLDPTWYSSIYGLHVPGRPGLWVLALSIITVIRPSQAEPMHTVLRKTEQHDLGKLAFAFVMLNIYLAFSQFLIIWSGNLPEEIPWYLDRIRGGWGVIVSLDFVFHWFIPFTLLLSRDLKRNKKRLVLVCKFMIFARCWDMFWLIEPNFADARRNLHFSFGILEYMTVPVRRDLPLDVVLLWPAAEAAVDPDQRSAPGRDFGGRACPRMSRTILGTRHSDYSERSEARPAMKSQTSTSMASSSFSPA